MLTLTTQSTTSLHLSLVSGSEDLFTSCRQLTMCMICTKNLYFFSFFMIIFMGHDVMSLLMMQLDRVSSY